MSLPRLRQLMSRLAALALVVGTIGLGPADPAAAACPRLGDDAWSCQQVAVPLDPARPAAGTISLRLDTLAATGAGSRGTMLMVAGGPGQGSARSFTLDAPGAREFYGEQLFPGYRLAAFDNRGTGDSGVLNCPSVQGASTGGDEEQAVARCARRVGDRRVFYSTRDHVADLEAVRRALGVEKLALFGVSYGSQLVLAYAVAHPDRVERVLVDSVVPPEGVDPFFANVLRAVPEKLGRFCAGGRCRAATPGYARDVTALAAALERRPARVRFRVPGGRPVNARLGGLDVVSLAVASDLSPGLAAALPAAVRAARAGRYRPFVRLAELSAATSVAPLRDFSTGLYLATTCQDGPFPWAPATPVAQRGAAISAAVAAQPPGAFGPFGPWAAAFGPASSCSAWPAPTGASPSAPGPLPDVPMLALSGGIDMRTPTADAVAVAGRFRQGRVLVDPGYGHSVLLGDPGSCLAPAVRRWLAGGGVPARCRRRPAPVATLAAVPRPLSRRAGARATRALVRRTVADAQAAYAQLVFSARPPAIPGLAGGRLVPGRDGATLRLERYALVAGVGITGRLALTNSGSAPWRFEGTVRASGSRATPVRFTLPRSRRDAAPTLARAARVLPPPQRFWPLRPAATARAGGSARP